MAIKSLSTNHSVAESITHATLDNKRGFKEAGVLIPYIKFPPELEIKLIYPFGGAAARFIARLPDKEKTVSVYLDINSSLGCMDSMYWEIYPAADGDIARFIMGDEEKDMFEAILDALNEEE